MSINIEDYLHKIDAVFKEKTQKDTYMMYIMIVGLVFAFSYLFFWDSSLENFKKTQENVTSLKSKINADKNYLKINTQSVIVNLDKKIQSLNEQIIQSKDINAYIKSKIETISFLIYDEHTWGEYLDSISTNAQKYHMQITDFSNKYATNNSPFGHVLDISISANGNYKNTLRFINSLEQSNLVVDIHDLNIEANKKLLSDLNISVWGITY